MSNDLHATRRPLAACQPRYRDLLLRDAKTTWERRKRLNGHGRPPASPAATGHAHRSVGRAVAASRFPPYTPLVQSSTFALPTARLSRSVSVRTTQQLPATRSHQFSTSLYVLHLLHFPHTWIPYNTPACNVHTQCTPILLANRSVSPSRLARIVRHPESGYAS